MSQAAPLGGLVRHFRLSLRLNFRSLAAVVYGYIVPLFFLLAFGSVFRGENPPLRHQMGQLLTITILGGACFGLPTALVAERERGVWRRYRLLPLPTGRLVASTMLARLVIVVSAALLQLALARLIYHTPWPDHPAQAVAAVLLVALSFLGLGLVVAALANDVPAVQALGQCLFLPMIMIGGVGVPLAALPGWAQRVAGFMPGRYAVDLLQRSFTDPAGLRAAGFSALALAVIGVAAGAIGLRLFRWEHGGKIARGALAWSGGALLAWIAVGVAAAATGRLEPALGDDVDYTAITDRQIEGINFDNLPGDDELVTRLAKPFPPGELPPALRDFAAGLKTWEPGLVADPVQATRNLLSVAAIADVGPDLREAEIGRYVFDLLQARYGHAPLRQILAAVILRPDDGTVVTHAPGLHVRREAPEPVIRERDVLYAKKFLGRLTGRLHDAP